MTVIDCQLPRPNRLSVYQQLCLLQAQAQPIMNFSSTAHVPVRGPVQLSILFSILQSSTAIQYYVNQYFIRSSTTYYYQCFMLHLAYKHANLEFLSTRQGILTYSQYLTIMIYSMNKSIKGYYLVYRSMSTRKCQTKFQGSSFSKTRCSVQDNISRVIGLEKCIHQQYQRKSQEEKSRI